MYIQSANVNDHSLFMNVCSSMRSCSKILLETTIYNKSL